jgi:signal transduction histidine kinase
MDTQDKPFTTSKGHGHTSNRVAVFSQPDVGPVRVLLLEDSESDSLLIRSELEAVFGEVAVIAVSRLAEGLQKARENTLDVALLDLNLPDSTGIDTFNSIHRAAPKLPIIVLTGRKEGDLAREVLRRGAQDYLHKGTDVGPLLVRSIVNAIERQRLATERDFRTRQVQDSEARTRTIIEANADATVIVDQEGIIQFVNPMATQMFGRPEHELVGQPFGFPTAKGQVTELDIRHGDGSTGVAEMRVTELLWGDRPAFLASLRDITQHKRTQEETLRLNVELERRVAERTAELREAKERAESSDRLKSAFLATMSHELRTPLNGIIGFSEFLMDGKAGAINPKQKDYLNDVLNSGRHLLQLINNLLDLSKIEAGKMIFAPETFRISAALREVCSVVYPLAQRKNVEIHHHVVPAVDEVRLDLAKFKQVLYNLLSNAVKFNRERGKIDVFVDGSSDRFCLRVSDSGIGIKPEDVSKLFVEFQQLDSSLSRRYEGTGLGLALTRRIVGLQDGEIKVSSEVGKGTTFIVELPRIMGRKTS